MSSGPNAARLNALTRELIARWRETRESWMDDKAREFEQRFIAELESSVSAAGSSIATVETTLRKLRSDCE